ncbi:CRISPR-associated protein Cas5 [Arthrobacter sp. NPDC092385]
MHFKNVYTRHVRCTYPIIPYQRPYFAT